MSGFNSGAGSDYGNYSVQDTNIKQGQYVVNTNASFTSVEGSKVVGTDNIENVNFDFYQNTQSSVATSVIDKVRAELDGKTVVEDRDTVEYEERFFSGHITKYDDGTVVLTDVNQNIYKNTVEVIKIPTEDGDYSLFIAGPNEDGLVCKEITNALKDDGSGFTVGYDVTNHYENREDGLTTYISNPRHDDYTDRYIFEGREDGIVQLDVYEDKILYYLSDGSIVEKAK